MSATSSLRWRVDPEPSMAVLAVGDLAAIAVGAVGGILFGGFVNNVAALWLAGRE